MLTSYWKTYLSCFTIDFSWLTGWWPSSGLVGNGLANAKFSDGIGWSRVPWWWWCEHLTLATNRWMTYWIRIINKEQHVGCLVVQWLMWLQVINGLQPWPKMDRYQVLTQNPYMSSCMSKQMPVPPRKKIAGQPAIWGVATCLLGGASSSHCFSSIIWSYLWFVNHHVLLLHTIMHY